MAVSALVFAGRNGLDFSDLRMGVVRIPEVMGRIREAQKILDGLDLGKADLLNLICSSDEAFGRDARVKSLAVAIVQVGLHDRFLKTQRKPDYYVGVTRGDSAAQVASGELSFQQLILDSPAIEALRAADQGGGRILTLVTELTLSWSEAETEEFKVLGLPKDEPPREADLNQAPRLSVVKEGYTELRQLVLSLNEELAVTRFIHIGPAGGLKSFDYNQLGNDEIEALDSIELDPMLGWFWRAYRGSQLDSRSFAN